MQTRSRCGAADIHICLTDLCPWDFLCIVQCKSCVRGQQLDAQQYEDVPHANKLSRLVVVAAACKGAASGAGQLRTAAPAKQGHVLAILHLVEPPEAGSMAAQGYPELPAQRDALLNSQWLPKHLGVATAP